MICEPNRSGEVDFAKDISESIFLLKKSSSSSTASIQVDFSPLAAGQQPTQSLPKALPIFNSDGHYFTPSFVLQADKQRYKQNEEIYFKIHNRKVSQISEQKAELFVPKPSKNNSYCCICKTPFEDYLTHINTPKHHYITGKSQFNQKIKSLCTQIKDKAVQKEIKLAQTNKKRGRPSKTKMIQKIFQKSEKLRTVEKSSQYLPISINS